MIPIPQIEQVAQTIQLALAPVFLLAGIGAFLNVCAGRLSRVIDRARKVEERVLATRGAEHDRLIRELRRLDRRMKVVNSAIFLIVASASSVCLVVILLFAGELFHAHLGRIIAGLFILSMALLAAAFMLFLQEVRLAAHSIYVRNEILLHKAPDESGD